MNKTQRMILLIFAVCAAPFVLGTVMYYVIKPQSKMNYGQVLETKPIALPTGATLDGSTVTEPSYRGKWWIVHTCSADVNQCAKELYASRQARTMLGKEMDRVARVVVVPTMPSAELQAAHPGVRWVVAPNETMAFKAPMPDDGIYLVDPLGNQVVRWPADPDIKALNKDLARLMRASRIG